jgi:hypothetical protein
MGKKFKKNSVKPSKKGKKNSRRDDDSDLDAIEVIEEHDDLIDPEEYIDGELEGEGIGFDDMDGFDDQEFEADEYDGEIESAEMNGEKHDSELSEIGEDDDQVGSFEDDDENESGDGSNNHGSLQEDADLGLEDHEEA